MKKLIPDIIMLLLGAVVGWLSRGGSSHDDGENRNQIFYNKKYKGKKL